MWNSPLEVKQKKILNVVIQISVIYVSEIFFLILPDKKIGLSSFFALSKASFPHGYLTKKGKKNMAFGRAFRKYVHLKFKKHSPVDRVVRML